MRAVEELTSGLWPGLTRGSRLLERPSWAPVVLSGALPRELSDLLAISILALASLESVFAQLQQFNQPAWFATLLVLVPLTCALAALSNSSRTQKEELALFAYGGSGLQIQFRYILRGVVLSIIGLSPLWLRFLATESILSTNLWNCSAGRRKHDRAIIRKTIGTSQNCRRLPATNRPSAVDSSAEPSPRALNDGDSKA